MGGRIRSEKEKAQVLDQLVDWLSEGKTLRAFARQKGTPTYRALYQWLEEAEKEMIARIARARDAGADAIADEALAIVDKAVPETWQVDRLRVETRLKLLAKWRPQRYGDKLQIGGDADAGPIRLTDTERTARLESILASAARRKHQLQLTQRRNGTQEEDDDGC